MFHLFISPIYQNFLKPFLFKKDPEEVHDNFIRIGAFLSSHRITRAFTALLFNYHHHILESNVDGLKYLNPIGLSAGFDKDANLHNIMPKVGFGFEEVGSVTLRPYEGNPKPRLYRLFNSKGLVVYYGLKNIGVEKIVERVKVRLDPNFILGISVAKTNSKDCSTDVGGIDDYVGSLKILEKANVGDYYTINISCPNTYGGEPFTTPERLDPLLATIDELDIQKPVYIKMPINHKWEEFDKLLQVVVKHRINGVVIGNLNKDRSSELIKDEIPEHIKGGISGVPTRQLSTELIRKTYMNYGNDLTIIGVGGIFTAEDAYEKILAGASLLQMITGMIFGGPQTIGEINRGLVSFLKRDGYATLSEAIGKGAIK